MLAPDCNDCAVRWSCSLEADGPEFIPCPRHNNCKVCGAPDFAVQHKRGTPTYTHLYEERGIPVGTPCDYCGSTEDVDRISDPFDADVHGDHTLHNLCDVCAEERAREI